MAYEIERNRFAEIITTATGIQRRRDADLERAATERASEARQQTGLSVGDEDGLDAIAHPTAEVRAQRLGVPLPPVVYTAELAIWKYLVRDPIYSLAIGLLSSAAHRAVLDNAFYDNWGIGIYTELPAGTTDEILRRWYSIVWLSNEQIGPVAMIAPSQTFSKTISFLGPGNHWGYKFGYDGRIISSKKIYLSQNSIATAVGRAKVPNRSGDWLLVANGGLTDHWVREDGFRTNPSSEIT